MDQKHWPVHESHCCPKHGCKYGDEDCPVTNRLTMKHNENCESCEDDFNNPRPLDLLEAYVKTCNWDNWCKNIMKCGCCGTQKCDFYQAPHSRRIIRVINDIRVDMESVKQRGIEEGWWKK